MIYDLPDIRKVDLEGKTVLLRADLDVPVSREKSPISQTEVFNTISDYSRLEAFFPTLEFLLNKGSKVIIAGHLGRPKHGEEEYGLTPVASWIGYKLGINPLSSLNYTSIGSFKGWIINENVSMLQNLRFFKEEEENDSVFAKKLAELADIYVNDAFASSHRNHASIVGVSRILPHYAGLRLQNEVEELSKVLDNPKRPLTVIIGGAKIETKLPLVEKMHHFADYVLVGGQIAEEDKVLLKIAHEKMTDKKSILLVADLNQEKSDITPHSFVNFFQVIQNSEMIVWNGPMGKISDSNLRALPSEVGTKELSKALANSKAYTIVGGGDTVAYLKKENLLNRFDFVSTGGGAMLEFLSGDELPGLKALAS